MKTTPICPRCGQSGQPVTTRTIKHQVRPEFLAVVEDGPFNFCRSATCDAAYFNGRRLVLTKADVRQRIGVKETEDPVPVCYCFGFTEKMILDEKPATAPARSAIPKAHASLAASLRPSRGCGP